MNARIDWIKIVKIMLRYICFPYATIIIAYQLYSRRQCKIADRRSEGLLPLVDDKRIEILLLKYLCVSRFGLNDFAEVLRICINLEARGIKDPHVLKYKQKAEEKISDNT